MLGTPFYRCAAGERIAAMRKRMSRIDEATLLTKLQRGLCDEILAAVH